ncbi:MAG: NAD(P)-binding protein [Gammaproteobacteria bacterium]|nr:NAD(P)-binding protein [Gammaproteobacteria bacterium]
MDLTRPADLKEHASGTGARRTRYPVYVDYLPPCNSACPAGEDIQGWLAEVSAKNFERAWQILVADNPMPAVLGRVCYHPCENSCNRTHIDSTVSIHAVERFLGDLAREHGWIPAVQRPDSGKRVLVIGAGPSGLSAAFHLRRLGHQVEIREAGPLAGGMMHFGIPAYRLPRDVLAEEIARIEAMGIEITLNHKVQNVLREKDEGQFDAVFVAIGAHLAKKVDIPARDAGQMLDALSFLKEADAGGQPLLGRRVAVYGGGNTAMDAARTARRLGAAEALIIYRRDMANMPAHRFEAEEALAEGIKINWLRTISEIDASNIKVEIMRIENGRPIGTGEFETLQADSLILALGQNSDSEFLRPVPGIEFERDGTVIVGPDMMTGATGIFAGGDMVPSERTVTVAVGHGKKAARHIDGYLRGNPYVPANKNPTIGHERLHMWYQTSAPARQQAHLPAAKAADSFNEIVGGLETDEAVFEAQRCLSCGNCFECDGCLAACPEDAVIKLGPGKRYRFDYEACTGCAVCYEQCPCHAIEMVPEGGAPANPDLAKDRPASKTKTDVRR